MTILLGARNQRLSINLLSIENTHTYYSIDSLRTASGRLYTLVAHSKLELVNSNKSQWGKAVPT